MPRAKKPIKPPPPPWTPEKVRQVAAAIWGDRWQTALADALGKMLMWKFTQSTIAKWYLTGPNRRPIPESIQVNLTECFGYAMAEAEEARFHAKEILEAHTE